jgi:AbrB family looped-hinge helix DNA binding protein
MAKITSKYQVTVPKIIAEQYGMHPGDEIEWIPAGENIRVVPTKKFIVVNDRETRLRLFDQATERHKKRSSSPKRKQALEHRGWTREDLYARGRAD